MAGQQIVSTTRLSRIFPRRGTGLGALLRSGTTVAALRDLTLSIDAGEVFGLLGPNGAGKTTLIKVLCTLVMPTSGIATVAGRDVAKDPDGVRSLVGFCGSPTAFYGRLSARQNLHFFATLHRLGGHQARDRIDSLADLMGLAGLLDQPVQDLSAGQQQAVGIARAMLGDPRVLLLDEPTRSLDRAATERWGKILRSFGSRGDRAAIIATHQLDMAESFCDRVAFLAEGRLIWVGPPREGILNRLMGEHCRVPEVSP